jgi:hypothetical protein
MLTVMINRSATLNNELKCKLSKTGHGVAQVEIITLSNTKKQINTI